MTAVAESRAARSPARIRRFRIEEALESRRFDTERGALLPTAWTAKAIAKKARTTEAFALNTLRDLERAGTVTSRRVRSGETLFKLRDPSESRGITIHYPN
jgi:hypothetical protein